MNLSEQLISQFAKTINANNSKNAQNASKTVYGEIVYNGQTYVKLDGSDLLTPVETTVSVKDGDRVTVKIENHTAIVTGNLSDPSASSGSVTQMGSQISEFEIIIADKVSVQELAAEVARIDTLVSDNVTIKGELEAAEASIEQLTADNVTITGKLEATEAKITKLESEAITTEFLEANYAEIKDLEATNANVHNLSATYGSFAELTTKNLEAVNADITNLNTKKLDAETAEITYATIDFANIDKAAVTKIFSDSGIIDDLIVSNGKITGTLVGVTIIGDSIKAGTVQADKLVVKGEDGIYYKLNIEGGATVTEEVTKEDLQNGLSGSIIVAKSITAEKVAVDDLVAFGATIAGFNIEKDGNDLGKLYSGVKASVDNSTPGVYMDDIGQFALGDSNNFLIFYKSDDGTYKLAISADSILFGSGKDSLETVVSDIDNQFAGTHEAIVEQGKNVTQGYEDAIARALEEYNKTGDFEAFKDTVNKELGMLTEDVVNKYTETTDRINNIDSGVQDKFAMLDGYIHIDPDNATITLGKSDNPITLKIENDMIGFYKNGSRFGWWDGNDFYTGNIVVETDQRAQFGNFAFLPRHDGSLSLRKVADYIRFMITKQPKDAECALNNYVNYSVTAVGEGLKYQWQFAVSPWYIWDDISEANGFKLSTGANTANLKFYCDSEFISSLDDPDLGPAFKFIRCAVTDSSGETLYTREAVLNISAGNASG